MYQYEYVSVEGRLMKNPYFFGYQDIINEYAEKGWRYVGYMPTGQNGHGKVYQIDLIFERKIEE